MSIPNQLTRAYLSKYKNTLQHIRQNSIDLQYQEKQNILNSKIFQNLHRNQKWEDIPISSYKDIESEILQKIKKNEGTFQPIKTYAKSAGTSSNDPKYIPTSRNYLKRNHVQAAWLTMYLTYALRPDMDIIARKNLLIGGAIYTSTESLVIADISGLMIRNIPRIFHRYYVPSIAEATIPDWEQKLQITAQRAAETDQVVMFAGVPTWILTVAREVLKHSNKNNLSEVWPHFKVYLHGGVHFSPYRSQFDQLFPDNDLLYLDVYNASEGFFAVQDTEVHQGLLLLTGHRVYYEFIRVKDYQNDHHEILNLSEIEIGQEYVLLISNITGLIRYVLGDTIRFTTLNPFRIEITGRISEFINAFGEDLTYENVRIALQKVNEKHDFKIRNYTIAPRYISTNQKGCHEYYIEFEKPPTDLDNLSQDIDDIIRSLNFSYHQKRADDLAMSCLEIIALPKGFFDSFAKSRNKFGGQNKLPKLRNDRNLVEEILGFLSAFE